VANEGAGEVGEEEEEEDEGALEGNGVGESPPLPMCRGYSSLLLGEAHTIGSSRSVRFDSPSPPPPAPRKSSTIARRLSALLASAFSPKAEGAVRRRRRRLPTKAEAQFLETLRIAKEAKHARASARPPAVRRYLGAATLKADLTTLRRCHEATHGPRQQFARSTVARTPQRRPLSGFMKKWARNQKHLNPKFDLKSAIGASPTML